MSLCYKAACWDNSQTLFVAALSQVDGEELMKPSDYILYLMNIDSDTMREDLLKAWNQLTRDDQLIVTSIALYRRDNQKLISFPLQDETK